MGIDLSTNLRYDRDIAANLLYMQEVSGIIEEKLFKKVIMYISKTFQKNLLNEGYFDPEEFCKECNVDYNYLLHPTKSPYQLRIPDEPKGKETVGDNGIIVNKQFNNRLENILFLLTQFNFTFTQKENDRTTTKSVQILKSIEAFKQGRKTRYYIEISDGFRSNMIRRFLPVNMESYISLCDSSSDELYLQICSLKSALKHKGVTYTTPENTIPFSILCRLAGISKVSKTGQEYPLKRIKHMLKTKLDAIGARKDMNFDVEWHRTDNPQEPYIVCFRFNNDSDFNRHVVSGENRDIINRAVNEEIIRRMAITYREIYKIDITRKLSEADFLDWLYNNDINEKDKFVALSRAYIEFGESHTVPDNIDEIFNQFRKYTHLKTPLDNIYLPKPVFKKNQ